MSASSKQPARAAGLEGIPAFEPRKDRLLSKEIVVGLARIGDFAVIVIAGLAAYGAWAQGVLGGTSRLPQYCAIIVLAAAVFTVGFQTRRGYVFERLLQLRWQMPHVIGVWSTVVMALLLFGFALKVTDNFSRGWALSWVVLTVILLVIERALLKVAIARWSRDGSLVRRVAILGAGETGERLIEAMRATGQDYEIVGLFDDRKSRLPAAVGGYDVAGTSDDLLALARASRIDEVVIALPLGAIMRIGELVQKLLVLPIDLRLSVEAMRLVFPVRGMSSLGTSPMINLADQPLKHWNGVLKSIEDKALAILALVLAAPLMAVVALLIKLDSRGPAFFVQERFGFDNSAVGVLKFRTMYVDRGDPTGSRRTARDDPRVTRVGRVLRALSLDELPQLLNVLKGDMSIVGPRAHPLAMKVEDQYYFDAVKEYPRRHRVKPGITGWAQVHGLRGEVEKAETARQRLAYDLYYIENWSIWLDLKIILMTFVAVTRRQNAF